MSNDFQGHITGDPYVKCMGCGKHAEMLDREHPEFDAFCRSQDVNPDDMQVVFRRVCECDNDLEVFYPSTLNLN
jgi:hypothetical protein